MAVTIGRRSALRSNQRTSDLAGGSPLELRVALVADGDAVAGCKLIAIELDRAAAALAARRGGLARARMSSTPSACERWPDRSARPAGSSASRPAPSGEATSCQRPVLALGGKRLLRVARRQARRSRQQPDLIQVDRLGRRRIELAVADAACRPSCAATRPAAALRRCPGCRCAPAPRQNAGHDLHVTVPMHAEALPGRDAVFVDHRAASESPSGPGRSSRRTKTCGRCRASRGRSGRGRRLCEW